MLVRALALTLMLATAQAAAPSDEEEARAAGAVPLSAEELRAMYHDHLVVGVTPGGYRFETRVEADGHVPATPRRAAGRFQVQGPATACMQFPDVWEGKLRCWTYYRAAEGLLMFREDGALAARLDLMPRD